MKIVSGDKKARGMAQTGFRRDYGALMLSVSAQIGGVLRRYADADGIIPVSRLPEVKAQAGRIHDRAYVGPDGRNPYAADGVTPLAEYPRILNKWYTYVVAAIVVMHGKWLKKNTPDDVFIGLTRSQTKPVPVEESLNRNAAQARAIQDALYVPGESLAEAAAKINPVGPARIMNPLIAYDPAHRFVDPKGYRLSDNIWQVSVRSRAKLDALLDDMIRNGYSATQISRRVEQFLHPERNNIRTNKPYGKDASYDGMRLGRTEIAASANRAARIAAYMNPYVSGIDVARSANGDPFCKVCPTFTTIDISQARVREPYPADASPPVVGHPHCMCRYVSVVTATAEAVTEWLRDQFRRDVQLYTTPAKTRQFLLELFGPILFALAAREWGNQLTGQN